MPSEQPSSIFQPQPGTLIVLKWLHLARFHWPGELRVVPLAAGWTAQPLFCSARRLTDTLWWLCCSNIHKHAHTQCCTRLTVHWPASLEVSWLELSLGGCMLEGWCGARWVTPFSPLLYAKEKECYMCTAKNGGKMTSALKLYVLIDCDHSFIWLTQQLALKNWMQVSLFVCEGLCCAKKPASAANQPLWILIC